ncbi:Putative signal-transduction protein [Idiomarina sp. A28L]|uniref:CBS domain-containing protein n=1 Tax=Idiomarina sp. A28L TaxID=1036674 RepID=UPI0002138685|nr:CBS domain-containing protein [Idiomarina sp. A28L]EGN74789.1 Putative signal-transduction protein [Idiomarina sp. A28L]
MIVRDVMINNVITISPFATLRQALSLLKSKNIKSLVVEKQSDHDAYGLITYTNILKTVIAEDGDIDLLNVYDVCVKPALSVGESLGLKHVAGLMSQHHVKRLLVVSDNNLVGFVTMNDIMEELMKRID